jgi:hypothetical protein
LYFKYRKSITIWDAWQPYFTVTGYWTEYTTLAFTDI